MSGYKNKQQDQLSTGSYWVDENNNRFRFVVLTNTKANDEQQFSHPITVVYKDQSDFWSMPLDDWFNKMTLLPSCLV